MKRRFKMSRRASRKNFKRGARKTHMFNIKPKPMRGGIRL